MRPKRSLWAGEAYDSEHEQDHNEDREDLKEDGMLIDHNPDMADNSTVDSNNR